MKKLIQLLCLHFFVFSLATGCAGTDLGSSDGEDGNEVTNNQTQQGHDIESNFTTFSAVQQVMCMVGGTDEEIMRFEKAFNKKKEEGNDDTFSAAYASQRVQGKSEAESVRFAKQETNAQRGILYHVALFKKGEAIALHLHKVYESKRAEDKSETWAGAYAKKVVLENKAHEEAEAYAEQLDNSLTIMEGLSTRAQPGDIEDQGLRAEMFREVLRANQPLAVAKPYADHYEQQIQGGKSRGFAITYAAHRALGKDHAWAYTYTEHYEQQLNQGKSVNWAFSYATKRVEGKDDTYSRIYAQHYDEQLQQGKSHNWIAVYAFKRAEGKDNTYARTYAQHYEEQLQQGKSSKWALVYAFAMAEGKSHDKAREIANRKYPEERDNINQGKGGLKWIFSFFF